MPDEKPAPLPLTGEEVQEAVLYKVASSLARSCHVHKDNAYTSFKAEISIRLTLSDYGREVKDNHIVAEQGDSGLSAESEPRQVDVNVTMEPMPPNQVRIETDQAVPVPTIEGGKKVIKHLKYAARKPKS
jgi:hypothetical protein